MPLRLVTYNIRGGLGMDGTRSIARIADVLHALDPDVICFQEVHRRLPQSGFQDQPARLSRLLKMQAYFQSNYRVGVGGFGNLILTRLPLLGREDIALPNPVERVSILRRMEGRGLLSVTVEWEGNPLRIMCTHWSLAPADRLNAAALVGRACKATAGPIILAGDLNALPGSLEVENLGVSTGLLDADAAMDRMTYPSDIPQARIDYVWTSSCVTVLRLEVIESLASDHRPLLAEIAPIPREISLMPQ